MPHGRSDEHEHDEETEGGRLRRMYEDSQGTVKALLPMAAKALINEKGLKYVGPDDLQDVPVEKWEEVAPQLEERKAQETETTLRQALKARGLDEEALDEALEELLGRKVEATGDKVPAAVDRVREVSGLGDPAQAVKLEDLHGVDAIEFGLSQKRRRT